MKKEASIVLMQSEVGVDEQYNFLLMQGVSRVHRYPKLSDGKWHVVLELHY